MGGFYGSSRVWEGANGVLECGRVLREFWSVGGC